ncbi:sugar ABC transporter permease, partial [Acinetobacter baumannii]
MTMVIVAGQIDISIGSQFAVLSVAAGVLAQGGLPMIFVLPLTAMMGAVLGGLNGVLVARVKIPAIVVTLAAMIVLR